MSEGRVNAPVAFIIFNRPDTTARVFAEIASAKPPMLLVVADGPKPGSPDQAEKCRQARSIIDRVDWPCKVLTHFSEDNLGCRRRVSSGLDWVFDTVPEAIILEDDCVPDPSFFRYCDELLAIHRDDERVGMVCGDNFQFGRKHGVSSYYFSKYAHIWGWASWRRAWRHYDVTASLWPELRDSGAFERITLPCERAAWASAFDGVHDGKIDTWDYQWTLACWCHSMLAVMPQVNLVSNIGFGPQATHTNGPSVYANLPVTAMSWPLSAPHLTVPHAAADAITAKHMFGGRSLGKRILDRVQRKGFP